MKFEQLIYEEKERVARITLNRPKVLNALSMQLSDEIVKAVEYQRICRSHRMDIHWLNSTYR